MSQKVGILINRCSMYNNMKIKKHVLVLQCSMGNITSNYVLQTTFQALMLQGESF